MAARAAEMGQPALGLTDHGVMNGAVDLYKACKKHGIKPIAGFEAYFVDDVKTIKERPKYERNHLTLLAEDDTGFANLVKLTSAGFLEGFSRGKANVGIARFARELGRPLVGTADVHYLRREDFDNHKALLCVQTKSTLEAPKLSFDTNEFYLKTSEEMAESFAEWPGAVPATLEIA